MSAIHSNFFSALGDESDEKPQVVLPVDKKSTSSKKTDKPPAKADPARAKPKKADPNGNNAAFKDKNAGRAHNKAVPVPESATSASRRSGPKEDRKPRGVKSDTDKRVRQGWGDNKKELQDEEAGERIAQADLAADAAEDAVETGPSTKTLDQYLAEQTNESLNLNRARREPNEGADNAKWANAKPLVKEDVVDESGRKKTLRSKTRKEVSVLTPDSSFIPDLVSNGSPRGDRSERSDRGPRPPRPARGDRSERGERAERGERSERGPRPPRGDRPSSGRAPRGERPERSERSERAPRGPKPTETRAPNLSNLPKLG